MITSASLRSACLLAAGLTLATMALVAMSGPARAADPYTVSGVAEDITAADANVAREQAFEKARQDAFATLAQRLVPTSDQSRVPTVSDSDLDNLVLAIQVEQEKRSSVRYIATLAVRFRPDMVKNLLSGAGITIVEWKGQPVDVLPVLQAASGPVLWGPANPWMDAWRGASSAGVIPFVVPQAPPPAQGGLPDAVEAAGGGQALGDFAQRLNASDVVIAVASLQPPYAPSAPDATGQDPDQPQQPAAASAPPAKLTVTLTAQGSLAGVLSGTRTYTANAGETSDQLLARAVADIAGSADDAFKGGTLVAATPAAAAGGPASTLSVDAPVSGLADWAALRGKLAGSPLLHSWQVTSLTRQDAGLLLTYSGDTAQLQGGLLQGGLLLSWAGDHWELSTVKPGETPVPVAAPTLPVSPAAPGAPSAPSAPASTLPTGMPAAMPSAMPGAPPYSAPSP